MTFDPSSLSATMSTSSSREQQSFADIASVLPVVVSATANEAANSDPALTSASVLSTGAANSDPALTSASVSATGAANSQPPETVLVAAGMKDSPAGVLNIIPIQPASLAASSMGMPEGVLDIIPVVPAATLSPDLNPLGVQPPLSVAACTRGLSDAPGAVHVTSASATPVTSTASSASTQAKAPVASSLPSAMPSPSTTATVTQATLSVKPRAPKKPTANRAKNKSGNAPLSTALDDAAKEQLTSLKPLPGQFIFVITDKYWHCHPCNESNTFDSGKTMDAHLRQKHTINMPAENKPVEVSAGSPALVNTESPNPLTQNTGRLMKSSDPTGRQIQLLKQQYVQVCEEGLNVTSQNDILTSAGKSADDEVAGARCCNVCQQSFSTSQNHQAHVNKYSKLRCQPVQCRVCKQMLHTLDQLNVHIFSDHLMDQSAACLACGASFDTYRKLINHIVNTPGMHPNSIGHTPTTLLADALVCVDCEKQISEFKRYVRSQCKLKRDFHKSAQKPLLKLNFESSVEPDVPASSEKSGQIEKTQKSQLKTVLTAPRNQALSPQKSVSGTQTQGSGKQCIFCQEVLATDRDQLRHMLQAHGSAFASPQDAEMAAGILMDDTNTPFTIEMDTGHSSEPASPLPPPDDVGNDAPPPQTPSTTVTRQSQIHVQAAGSTAKQEQSGTDFACKICGETMKSKAILRRHSRQHARNDKGGLPFKCNLCRARFHDELSLKKHKIKHQSTSKACKYCFRKFLTQEGVKNHEKHRHEDPEGETKHFRFKCDICSAKFSKQYALSDHKLTAHGNSDRHQCQVCGVSYSHINSLHKHMRFEHENLGYKCDTCGEMFKHKKWLIKHKVVHTGVDPLQCGVCCKSFMTRYSLAHHMQRHTGHRPFKCETCDKTYVLNSHLNRHKKVCAEQLKRKEKNEVTKNKESMPAAEPSK